MSHDRLDRTHDVTVASLREQLGHSQAEKSELHTARQYAKRLSGLLDAAPRDVVLVRSHWIAIVIHTGKASRPLINAIAKRDSAQRARAAAIAECAAPIRREQAALAKVRSLQPALQELPARPGQTVCHDDRPATANDPLDVSAPDEAVAQARTHRTQLV